MHEGHLPLEEFPALKKHAGFTHGFVGRVPGIDAKHDKAEALRRLDVVHREARARCGFGNARFVTAEQVHGDRIGFVDATTLAGECFQDCDGLVTSERGVCLGIYVADCCAVYLLDPIHSAIGLVHSGKKGTEMGIVGKAIDLMRDRFGSKPPDLVMQLSPCIRPPHYEIDFAATIVRDCCERGVQQVHDAGVCTACHLDRYYSYRVEKGKTGRMLALLAINSGAGPV